MMTQFWQTFDDPRFNFTFAYPTVTDEGDPIAIDDIRVHFQSTGSRAFYWEISRHLAITPVEVYEREKSFLVQRFPQLIISELTATTVAESVGWTFSFQWPEGERTVLLIESEDKLYRIIYDPTLPLNQKALATLKFK